MQWPLILVGMLILVALIRSRAYEGFSNFTRQNPAVGAAERYGGYADGWIWGWPFWSASCKLAGCPGMQTCRADSVGFTFCSGS